MQSLIPHCRLGYGFQGLACALAPVKAERITQEAAGSYQIAAESIAH